MVMTNQQAAAFSINDKIVTDLKSHYALMILWEEADDIVGGKQVVSD